MIAATVANFSGNRKKGSEPLKPEDFFPALTVTDTPAGVVGDVLKNLSGLKIVRPVDRELARKAASRPPKRKRR